MEDDHELTHGKKQFQFVPSLVCLQHGMKGILFVCSCGCLVDYPHGLDDKKCRKFLE